MPRTPPPSLQGRGGLSSLRSCKLLRATPPAPSAPDNSNGVKLVSITREMGDDPMHVMMGQIMALFDEYQSKENATHVMRALKENARQGFWNGSLPPIGYCVVAAEQRGAKIKKKLEIDPLHADTVRLIYRLALSGDGTSGQMGSRTSSAISTAIIFARSPSGSRSPRARSASGDQAAPGACGERWRKRSAHSGKWRRGGILRSRSKIQQIQ